MRVAIGATGRGLRRILAESPAFRPAVLECIRSSVADVNSMRSIINTRSFGEDPQRVGDW
jgi:hypothetical protein